MLYAPIFAGDAYLIFNFARGGRTQPILWLAPRLLSLMTLLLCHSSIYILQALGLRAYMSAWSSVCVCLCGRVSARLCGRLTCLAAHVPARGKRSEPQTRVSPILPESPCCFCCGQRGSVESRGRSVDDRQPRVNISTGHITESINGAQH